MGHISNEERAQLREFLNDRFNLDEMKTLSFDLGIDFEALPHATKSQFSRELVAYFHRNKKLGCLIAAMVQERPDEWLGQLLAKVASCAPNQKVQIILSNDTLQSRADLKQKLAELLGIPADDVMILATAVGSIHLLLGLPATAVLALQQLPIPYQLGHYQLVSVVPYAQLPPLTQAKWRTAVNPPTLPLGPVATSWPILKISAALLVLLLVGISTAVWLLWRAQPSLQIINQCADPLPLPMAADVRSLLSLPEAILPNQSVTLPIMAGTYQLLAQDDDEWVLHLPRPLPVAAIDQFSLGEIEIETAVTLNGRTLQPPQQFEVQSGQTAVLILCDNA